MLRVVKNLAKSLNVVEGHRKVKTVPSESLGTVFYSHWIVTIVTSNVIAKIAHLQPFRYKTRT